MLTLCVVWIRCPQALLLRRPQAPSPHRWHRHSFTVMWRPNNSLIVGRSPGEGIGYPLQYSWASLVAQLVKNPPRMRETWVGKIPWRRELATHSSILAWRIPWDRQELDTTERLLLSFLLMAKAKSEPLLLLKRKDKSVVVALIQLFYFHKLTLKTKFHIGTKT